MKRILLQYFTTAFLSAACVLAHGEGTNSDIYGTWKIQGAVGFADSFGLSDQQIQSIIGKPVVISAKQFSFKERTCKHPAYSRSMEETTSYFRRE
ncbi:MAG: hypothetical protein V4508_04350 [Pseudomonadota bacterium]